MTSRGVPFGAWLQTVANHLARDWARAQFGRQRMPAAITRLEPFDQALYRLYSDGEITYDAALSHADSPNDLRLMIKLGADANPNPLAGAESLQLEANSENDSFSYRR